MNFFRVGVVDFFGILCPGVLLLINILVFLFACSGQDDHLWKPVLEGVGWFILPLLLFVICYLFGFILRLISPDHVDKASTLFKKLKAFRRYRSDKHDLRVKFEEEVKKSEKLQRIEYPKKQFEVFLEDYYDKLIETGEKLPKILWIEERYPYYFSHKYRYYKNFPPKVGHAIMGSKKEYYNKDTYNFWKTLLINRDPNLATQVFQAEASVRFMSGSFWALFIGILSGIFLVIMNLGSIKIVAIGICLTTISILMATIILNGFKNQRRREVKALLDAIFVTSKVGHEHDPLGKDYFE